jgi:hypothetical protein
VTVNVLVVRGRMASAEAIVPPLEQLTVQEIGFQVTKFEPGNPTMTGNSTIPPDPVHDKA